MKIWELFPDLVNAVRELHDMNPKVTAAGHDFDHDLRVAAYAQLVADDERVGILAAVAGMCHSADRFVQAWHGVGRGDVPEGEVKHLVRSLMSTVPDHLLSQNERGTVTRAVLRHGRRNEADDDPVTIDLKDGDRIANCDPDVVGRSTRYHPDYPIVDYVHLTEDPSATYQQPRSVLRDIFHCLEWADPRTPFCVRMPRAKKEIDWRADILRQWILGMVRSRTESGLFSYYVKESAKASVDTKS